MVASPARERTVTPDRRSGILQNPGMDKPLQWRLLLCFLKHRGQKHSAVGTASALGEGGSGIAKVKKILTRDLNCAKNTICMKAEQGKCITNVTIYLDKFKV